MGGMETLYTSAQFAARVGVSRQYIERLEKEGKLPADARTVAGRPLWSEMTVERFADERERTRSKQVPG